MTGGTGQINGNTQTGRQRGRSVNVCAVYGTAYTAASGSSGANFTQRTEGVDKTPPHRFFQISQSLFSSPVKEI